MICFERIIVERSRIVKRRDFATFEMGCHGNRPSLFEGALS